MLLGLSVPRSAPTEESARTRPHISAVGAQASAEQYEHLTHFPALFCLVVFFCFMTGVWMVNLLTAQLSCAYHSTFQAADGLGKANDSKDNRVSQQMQTKSTALAVALSGAASLAR